MALEVYELRYLALSWALAAAVAVLMAARPMIVSHRRAQILLALAALHIPFHVAGIMGVLGPAQAAALTFGPFFIVVGSIAWLQRRDEGYDDAVLGGHQ